MQSDEPKGSKNQSLSYPYALRSGLAGGVAGCVAKSVVAPLDRVKILFQTSNPEFQKYAGTWSGAYRAGVDIYRQGGLNGLYQGHSATLLRIFPYAAIKYMFYDQIHHTLMPTRESETNLRRFAAGSISGTLSVCCTYPLELIRVRLAYFTHTLQARQSSPSSSPTPAPRPSLRSAISNVYRETAAFKPNQSLITELRITSSPAKTLRAHLFYHIPLFSFYRGFTVTLLGMVPYAGTSFLTWGYLRSLLIPPILLNDPSHESTLRHEKPTPLLDLTIGALAGSTAQTVSYPFEIIRRRMQVGGITNADPRAWLGFSETVAKIWRTQGLRGFYVGLMIGYVKVIPMTATSFAVWQWGKRLLGV